MRTSKLLTTLAIASVVLIAGCNEDELWRNAPDPANWNANPVQTTVLAIVPLGGASNFSVLAGTTVTNDGESLITGDLGVSPGSAISGFQPVPINTIMGDGTVTAGLGIVNGTIYAGGPVAAQAHNDAVKAYDYLVAQEPNTTYSGVTQLDGRTFTPGVYNFPSSANLQVDGTLYLDFQGNSDALFIFQMGTTLVTMTGSNVIAINNNNQPCSGSNVYWAVGSSATIYSDQFVGTVIAKETITMTSGAKVSGRILALNAEVTMIKDTISVCGGGTVPPKPCRDFVTGGGWISHENDKATFDVSGGIKNGKFWGQLSYNDHGMNGVNVKSTSVTSYTVIDSKTRQIEGIAEVNGKGSFTYKVVVVDNGEPGRNDSFSLELSNGYSASGTLEGGNIQLHMECGESNDNDSPMVTSTDPLNNATGVAHNKVVALTFSEAMDPLTINTSTFTLKQGTTAVSGTVAYSGTTATFTPSNVLAPSITYTATITTGAKDLAGNALAANTVWSFTTAGATSGLAVVDLGAAGNYVILAKSAITNIPTSAVTGDLGLSPAATSFVTGFALTNATGYATSPQVTGNIYAADMADPTPINLTTAVNNMITAYNDAAGRLFPDFSELGTGNIGGKTLAPGLYKWTSTVTLPSDVTISGGASDVWIFQISGDLTVSSAVNVTLSGGALAKNIFWQVAGQATLGTTSHFEGIILSMTGINFQTGASMNGRALAQTAVVLDGNAVTKPQ